MRYKTILSLTLLLMTAFFITSIILLINYLPAQAQTLFGPADTKLDFARQLVYSARLLIARDQILLSSYPVGQPQKLTIISGETANQVSQQLYQLGLIGSADGFNLYIKYSGLETRVRAGKYLVAAGKNVVQITRLICDLTPDRVKFVILPGMRVEEIAALLPTSGLNFDSQKLIETIRHPQPQILPDVLKTVTNLEGFLFPGEYEFSRNTSVDEIAKILLDRFVENINAEMMTGWQKNNLTLSQGVILASLIQREVVLPEEAPLISSVFINRLSAGMKLESDPTVQYAVGNSTNGWWKNPLSIKDLDYASDFNTYQISGLPPAAICNPDLNSLRASAFPARTVYYFFQARCDQSGKHNFFATYAEHLANLCIK
jgi:UPF0755 protein